MACFCLLSDPGAYVAQDWDLTVEHDSREHWLALHRNHFKSVMIRAAERYGPDAADRIARARAKFGDMLHKVAHEPSSLTGGRLGGVDLDRLSETILQEHDLGDPFALVKQRENDAATALYKEVLGGHEALSGREKWLRLVRGVLAGNMFDVGPQASLHADQKSPDFLKAIEQVVPDRPWRIDDFDRLWEDLSAAPPAKWRKVVAFVDNAGGDFILGVLPLVRALAGLGARIVLAANELPSLNDITAREVRDCLDRLAGIDRELAGLMRQGRIEVISSGNDLPTIDLSDVDGRLNDAVADADLVILEGMGRAIETNFDAAFKVDALLLALVKDEDIGGRIGARLYDCVCKYTRRPERRE